MSALGRLALWCLKNARTPDELVRRLRDWADLVGEVARAPNGLAALALIFRYIYVVSERSSRDELVKVLAQAVGEEGKATMVTIADELRAEGEQKGRRELLLRLLSLRFGELPKEAQERVSTAAPDLLERWVDRILFAQTLDELLENA